ncbi:MAG: Alkyl hydroperoxide reductase and/or thiol-specific antioxidant family (AhpC/TSA) protein [Verrucomicrobiaceae bacterium]|nr:Alkyl hydroperoxide reductase and/or thiol-specific antioxidant family (AhpC/TSA) protein [Verrucomicrobiaceae bacterium]
MAEVPSTRTLSLGSPAPVFALPEAAGSGVLTLAEVRGPRGLVVAFVCNHCPFEVMLAEAMGAFAEECLAQGVGFVAINANDAARYPADAPARMPAFGEGAGWHFPYLVDAEQTVAQAYFAACTPDFYVFDQDLRLTYCGQFDEARPGNGKPVTGKDLRAAVAAVLAGEPPLATQRPSTGCSIKWKPGGEPAYFGRKMAES